MLITKSRFLIILGVIGFVAVIAAGMVLHMDPANQLLWEVRRANEPWTADGILYAAFWVKKLNREHAVIPGLIESLSHPNRIIRSKAARALREINVDPELAVPVLLRALSDSDDDVRCQAVIGLGKVRPVQQQVVEALIAMRSDEETRVRCEVVSAFEDMGPEADAAIPMLIESLSDQSIMTSAMAALGNMGPAAKQATPTLLKIAKEAGDYYRCYAAEAIWQIEGDPEVVVPVLIELLKGRENMARRNAARALEWIGPPAKAAIPALIEVLEYQPKAPEPEVNDPSVPRPAIRSMTEYEFYPQIREAATRALQRIKRGTD